MSESIMRVGDKTRDYLSNHSLQIAFVTSAFVCLFASINYDYHVNPHHDLIFWMEIFDGFIQTSVFRPTLSLFVAALIKIQIFSLIVYLYLMVSNFRDERKKQLYAEFIFRRLIAQLDCASQKCATKINGTEEHNDWYRDAQDVFIAINVFRHDVRRVFGSVHCLHCLSVDDLYHISDQEQRELKQMGYDKLKVNVTEEFLLKLCSDVST